MKFSLILFLIYALGNLHAAKPIQVKNLFEKDDFSQWTKVNGEKVDNGWTVKNGVIHRHSKGGDIITKEKFKDFELTFDWKISEAGNSGIKYRTRRSLGLEYQVLLRLENGKIKANIVKAQLLFTMNPKLFDSARVNREECLSAQTIIKEDRVETLMPLGATHAAFCHRDANNFLLTPEPFPSF